MVNKNELLRCIDKMNPEDVVKLIREALEESKIPYEEGGNEIIFEGLFSKGRCRGCMHEFDWGYPGCNDCARMYQDKYVKEN